MSGKRKKTKTPVKPMRVGFWGTTSCMFGIAYMTYFIYLTSVFHTVPSMNFQFVLYAFSVFPFGLLGLLAGIVAVRKADVLGFGGVISNVLGMSIYSYIWYEVMMTPPHSAIR